MAEKEKKNGYRHARPSAHLTGHRRHLNLRFAQRRLPLFGFFGKKKKETPVLDAEENAWEEVLKTEPEKNQGTEKLRDAKLYFQTMEEQMGEAFGQLKEAKTEYGAVTSYLTDIQKIDRMAEEELAVAVDAAKRIIVCTREREHLLGRVVRLTKDQYQMAEQYEEEMPSIIKNLKSNEDSLVLVKNDMRLLEGEKGRLFYEREELVQKQKSFQNVIRMVLVLVFSLFALFLVLYLQTGLDVNLPVMATLAAAAVIGSYVFLESVKDKRDLLLNERKMNKAISLLNTTKIRFVNYSGTIDYMKAKYHISNSIEMNHIWTQYMKAKEEEKRYLRNSQMLELYQGVLTAQMKKTGLEDPEIWIYQPEALADEKEMVEVRHRLNDRRGKLREKIEYNQELILAFGKELSDLVAREPEYARQVQELLGKFGLKELP